MSRWFLNPMYLVRNWRDAVNIVRPGDRWSYLRWLYYDKFFGERVPSGPRVIGFQMPPPVGALELLVRNNKGADQLVIGEVLRKYDYAIDIPPPETILDLGGNIGCATIYFARRWPNAEIAVMEPVPSNLEILNDNLRRNAVRATVLPNAVACADSTVTIAFGELDCSNHIVDRPGRAPRGSIEVAALSIPTVMQKLGWKRIGLLKVDIEGYEAILFRRNNRWLELVDAVCLEAYDGTISGAELEAIAERFGFQSAMQPNGIYYWIRPKSAA